MPLSAHAVYLSRGPDGLAASAGGPHLRSLATLLSTHGASVAGCRVAASGDDERGERGLIAARDFAPKEEVLAIPRSAMLSALDGATTQIGRAISASGCKLFNVSTTMAAVGLLHQRHAPRDDLIAAYVESLPTTEELAHIPIMWPAAARKALLCGSARSTMYGMYAAQADLEYALCLEAAPDLKRVCPSAEDWRWAHTNARARLAQCGDIRAEAIAEGEGEIALHLAVLAPYFDLCNHAAIPSLSWWWDPVRDVLVLSAKAALPRGSPLTIGYGAASNGAMLERYGFCNLVTAGVKRSMHKTGKLIKRRLELVDPDDVFVRAPCPDHGADEFTARTAAWGPRATKLVQLRVGNEADLTELLRRARIASSVGPPGGVQTAATERRALALAHVWLADAMAGYPTSREEDTAFLGLTGDRDEGPPCPPAEAAENEICARILVRGEKRALLHFLGLCASAIAVLGSGDGVVARFAAAKPGLRRGHLQVEKFVKALGRFEPRP